MTRPRELGERWGASVAQRSPRLGGALAVLLGGAFFGLGIYIDRVVFLVLASLSVGSGAWIFITGRTWKVPDHEPPVWWKVGFVMTVGACVAAMYAYVFSHGAVGL